MLITNQRVDKLSALHTDLVLNVQRFSLTDTSAKSRQSGPGDDDDDNPIV